MENSNNKNSFYVNAKMIKTIKNIMIYPLNKVINEAFDRYIFAKVLKNAKVISIFKNKRSN